jgi:L-2,4-diaminobutyrate decarboxylase
MQMSQKPTNLPYFLGPEKEKKDEYRRVLTDTIEAITASVDDQGAYRGASVESLQQALAQFSLLPKQGIGWEALLEQVTQTMLPHFLRTWSPNYMAHLHSPALLESIAGELIIATFNQSMDSWDQSPIATEVEVAVVNQLCELYGYKEGSDGVFTSGGSQSNLSAITMARDWYCSTQLGHDVKKEGLPPSYHKLRLYTSEISHFSMEKSAHLLGLGYNAVRKVPVDDLCRMDVEKLNAMIESDKQAGFLPFCLVATIGTTDYGSIDPVGALRKVCDREGMFLHADAAYGSGLQLSPTYRSRLGDLSLCDSITVDFHKMFLLPISCGALLVKNKEHFSVFTLHADYLNREEDEEEGYTNLVGKSLQTTRRGDALKVWMAFQCRGEDGYGKIIDTCTENAAYLAEELSAHDSFTLAIEPELSSVVFRHNGSCELNKRIRKELLHHHQVVIGQTVYKNQTYLKFTLLNPTLTKEHLSQLLTLIDTLATELQ